MASAPDRRAAPVTALAPEEPRRRFALRRDLAAALGHFLPPPGLRVGLLGGSFNPAHAGHCHISREALKRLRLDEVWWLVSPQNPLKPSEGMAPLAERLAAARRRARDQRIRVTGIEALLGSVYTAQTLRRLRALFPRVHFVWLMGADNLIQIARWEDWQEIFNALPIAVFDRPTYSVVATSAKAARRFGRDRLPEQQAGKLAEMQPPAWVLLRIRKHPLSATRIRAGLVATFDEVRSC